MNKAAPDQPAPYVFDIQLDDGTTTVQVDSKAQYGWFENNTSGSGGGLWFEANALTDYDGVYCLPMGVIRQLRAACFTVDADFE